MGGWRQTINSSEVASLRLKWARDMLLLAGVLLLALAYSKANTTKLQHAGTDMEVWEATLQEPLPSSFLYTSGSTFAGIGQSPFADLGMPLAIGRARACIKFAYLGTGPGHRRPQPRLKTKVHSPALKYILPFFHFPVKPALGALHRVFNHSTKDSSNTSRR